jgi:hypothetical protein
MTNTSEWETKFSKCDYFRLQPAELDGMNFFITDCIITAKDLPTEDQLSMFQLPMNHLKNVLKDMLVEHTNSPRTAVDYFKRSIQLPRLVRRVEEFSKKMDELTRLQATLTFVMATHPRLGAASPLSELEPGVIRMIAGYLT